MSMMKERIISNLYNICIVAGLIIVLTSKFFETNWTYGEVWNQEEVEAIPYEILKTREDVTEYYFRIEDLTENGNTLYAHTTHHNVYAYRDAITEENLIYAHVSTESFLGRTNGTVPNFIEIPMDAQQLIVVTQAIYEMYENVQYTFLQGNAVGMIIGYLRSSSVEANTSSALILIGMAMFTYWLVMSRKLKLDKSVLYFSIITMILGFWTFNETMLSKLLFPNRTLCSLMGYLLLLIIPQPYILFAKTFLRLKDKIIYKVLCVGYAVVTIGTLILHMTKLIDYREMAIVVHMGIFCGILYMLYALQSRVCMVGFDSRVRVNLVGAVLLMLTTLLDLTAFYVGKHDTDVIGRFGMLLYMGILSTEVVAEFTHQMEENRKITFYKGLALVDMLTGCYNNNAFCQWQNTEKSKLHDAFVMMDLNDLKKCNDTYGHLVGDQYIVDATQLISEAFDKVGTCYRVGGDEFCVIVLSDKVDKITKCIQYLQNLQEQYNKKSDKIKMQIACGYAIYETTDKDLSVVLERADSMMYENKKIIKRMNS